MQTMQTMSMPMQTMQTMPMPMPMPIQTMPIPQLQLQLYPTLTIHSRVSKLLAVASSRTPSRPWGSSKPHHLPLRQRILQWLVGQRHQVGTGTAALLRLCALCHPTTTGCCCRSTWAIGIRSGMVVGGGGDLHATLCFGIWQRRLQVKRLKRWQQRSEAESKEVQMRMRGRRSR